YGNFLKSMILNMRAIFKLQKKKTFISHMADIYIYIYIYIIIIKLVVPIYYLVFNTINFF
ncbi:MAG: hypothetical protein MCS20_02380, partial [Candidatus Phytoplasma mali]|nr:hypothetical protein [Candidatus Phytoplasma australiense]MCG7202229.1 hypothetical protein [Candidatus Phytoplasma mali]